MSANRKRNQSNGPAHSAQAPRPDHEHREGAVWIPAAALLHDPVVRSLSEPERWVLFQLCMFKGRGQVPTIADDKVAGLLEKPLPVCLNYKRRFIRLGLIDDYWDLIADWAKNWPMTDEETETLNRREEGDQGGR
jgi:hypothetical protein